MVIDWQNEVFEIRPPKDATKVMRYNNGLWTPDDGEWDLAFYGYGLAPFAWYMSLPYYTNYQWGFLTTHWGASVEEHPRGNAWHYVTSSERDFTKKTYWGNRGQHLNTRTGDAAMSKMASEAGCANGRGAAFEPHNEFIQEGRVRVQRTGEIVTIPHGATCIFCDCPIEKALTRL